MTAKKEVPLPAFFRLYEKHRRIIRKFVERGGRGTSAAKVVRDALELYDKTQASK